MTDNNSHSSSTDRRTFLKAGGASTIGMTALSGCLTGGGGGGDGGGSGDSGGDGDGGSDGGSDGSDGDGGDTMDFGGAELDVMLNVGAIGTVHQEHLIPRVEERYNLNINTTTAVTTEQLTQVEANPESPPDVLIPDVIGIERASREEWLEPLTDHTDMVPNVEGINDKFVHYDGAGASWEVGEVLPVINSDMWDSTPSSHEAVMSQSSATAAVPFSWSGGPYLLLMASAIATGEPYDSRLDVDAGFDWLEENFAPNVSSEYGGVASAKQQLASGNVDALNLFWDYMVFDMFQDDQPIDPLFRLDPTGIAFAESVAVTRNANNMDAALVYANECLSPWFQEKASEQMGSGVTHEDASVAPAAEEFGATTSDEFDQLSFPDFQYIWENRSDWSERYNSLF
jgi:spermidine/putrescine-binding protein